MEFYWSVLAETNTQERLIFWNERPWLVHQVFVSFSKPAAHCFLSWWSGTGTWNEEIPGGCQLQFFHTGQTAVFIAHLCSSLLTSCQDCCWERLSSMYRPTHSRKSKVILRNHCTENELETQRAEGNSANGKKLFDFEMHFWSGKKDQI